MPQMREVMSRRLSMSASAQERLEEARRLEDPEAHLGLVALEPMVSEPSPSTRAR